MTWRSGGGGGRGGTAGPCHPVVAAAWGAGGGDWPNTLLTLAPETLVDQSNHGIFTCQNLIGETCCLQLSLETPREPISLKARAVCVSSNIFLREFRISFVDYSFKTSIPYAIGRCSILSFIQPEAPTKDPPSPASGRVQLPVACRRRLRRRGRRRRSSSSSTPVPSMPWEWAPLYTRFIPLRHSFARI